MQPGGEGWTRADLGFKETAINILQVHAKQIIGIAAAGAFLASILVMAPANAALTQQAANKAATDAYEFGFPIVLMDVTKTQATNVAKPTTTSAAPLGQFSNIPAFPPPENHAVVAPNADTLYSVAWVNLAREPMILHVPDYKGRYFLMPMLDMWTNVFQSPGSRTGYEKGGNFAVVGPGWSGTLPSGLTKFKRRHRRFGSSDEAPATAPAITRTSTNCKRSSP